LTIENKQFKKVCLDLGFEKNQFAYSYINGGKKIRTGPHKGFSAKKIKEVSDVFA